MSVKLEAPVETDQDDERVWHKPKDMIEHDLGLNGHEWVTRCGLVQAPAQRRKMPEELSLMEQCVVCVNTPSS